MQTLTPLQNGPLHPHTSQKKLPKSNPHLRPPIFRSGLGPATQTPHSALLLSSPKHPRYYAFGHHYAQLSLIGPV